MSLLTEVERILGNLAQEVHDDASVLVQFAAGDWNALKEAFNAEKEAQAPVVQTAPAKGKKSTPAVDAAPADVAPATDAPAA